MTKHFNFNIAVSTNADIDGAQIAAILDKLINIGLGDASDTLEAGEGDLSMAQLATEINISTPTVVKEETSEKVMHWDAYHVEGCVHTHQFDIADCRKTDGQAYITVGAIEGDPDEMISATVEVNTNPLTGIEHVPCVHIHFDGDAMAMSLFKIGNKILARPETGVSIRSFFQSVNGFGEEMYWIE